MEDQRRVSLELFLIIKPTCVELSKLSTLPPEALEKETRLLTQCLQTLCNQLDHHEKEYAGKHYSLSTKFADYAFFPISNLLKQPSLLPSPTKHVLHIIGFLLAHSWLHEINETLIDQLSPIIVYLCGGQNKSILVSEDDLGFYHQVVYCINKLVRCFPRDYYNKQDEKRLSVLGDITSLLLDLLGTIPQPLDQERNELSIKVLECLTWLYSVRVNAEQSSFVFPGIISKVAKFVIISKNLHTKTIIAVFELLKALIVKIFSDLSLDAKVVDTSFLSTDLSSLKALYDDPDEAKPSSKELVKTEVNTPKSSHRSQAWLSATSKQLKIALITIFRHLLIKKSVRDKIATNLSLRESLFAFLKEVTSQCFRSLFSDIILTFTDITSLLIFSALELSPGDSEELYEMGTSIFLAHHRDNLDILHKALDQKADDLVSNQLPRIFISTDDEKVHLTLVAIRFHLHLMDKIVAELASNNSMELKQLAVLQICAGVINRVLHSNGKKHKKDSKVEYNFESVEAENSMDSVVLPLHINAKSITKIRNDTTKASRPTKASLTQLTRAFDCSGHSDVRDLESLFFPSSFTSTIEKALLLFIQYVGESAVSITPIIDHLLMELGRSSDALLRKGVFLWASNTLVLSFGRKHEQASMSELVTFYDDEPQDDSVEESLYLVLETAKAVFDDTEEFKQQEDTNNLVPNEATFSIAIKSLGILSTSFSKQDFETDVLMDYLYLLLEAMTHRSDSLVNQMARSVLNSIAREHYEGSLQMLVEANADYLIDTLSLKLTMNSGLTPSLPGILLVVLKISGVELVKSNQLRDILSEIFIVIDLFHGYSVLVENFFMVFEEAVALIKSIYLRELLDSNKLKSTEVPSPFKPWGIANRDQLIDLLDEKNRQGDPFSDYDPEKEYFERKPGVPFGDQDSDDDSDNEEEPPEAPLPWPSPIPEDTYNLVLQVFKYGLQLLTHPSIKLRLTIFKTLENAYLIVASNYERLMPVLAESWPVLMSLASGTKTVSDWESANFEHSQLTGPAIHFATTIFAEDAKHQAFMSRRFLDLWEFLRKHNLMFILDLKVKESNAVVSGPVAPSVRKAYVELFVTALNNYERQIPHQTALDIARVCTRLGLDETQFHLSRDLRSALWVVKHYS